MATNAERQDAWRRRRVDLIQRLQDEVETLRNKNLCLQEEVAALRNAPSKPAAKPGEKPAPSRRWSRTSPAELRTQAKLVRRIATGMVKLEYQGGDGMQYPHHVIDEVLADEEFNKASLVESLRMVAISIGQGADCLEDN